jgi:hypothetical protein
VADHRDQAEVGIGHVDVPVPAARRAVAASHVLREDAPRLDAAHDVDAHVAVEGRADVVRAHRGRDTDGCGLVAAAGIERAGDLALAVEDVPALLDTAGDQHVAVDAEQVLAVEACLPDLAQGADRFGSRRNRQDAANCNGCARASARADRTVRAASHSRHSVVTVAATSSGRFGPAPFSLAMRER